MLPLLRDLLPLIRVYACRAMMRDVTTAQAPRATRRRLMPRRSIALLRCCRVVDELLSDIDVAMLLDAAALIYTVYYFSMLRRVATLPLRLAR